MMENSKGQKLSYGQSSSNGEDRISSLPDEILHHILAHFSTDEVVRYSILSTRWKYIWTSIPNLVFKNGGIVLSYEQFLDYKDPKNVQKFQNFVDRVLSHRGMSNIDKFRLECSDICGGSCLETWISILARHKLGELVLRIGGENFTFLNFLAVFKSLTLLVLSFPNLKVVHFELVGFSADKSTQEVSFSFPVLEEFHLVDCCWMEIKIVHIYAPALKKLTLEDSEYETELDVTEVKMDAMNLGSLSISEIMLHDYHLSYLPSLLKASVDVGRDSDNKRLVKCVTRLNHVKNLTLSDRCIKNLFSADILNNLQVFASLISLTVTNRSNAFSGKHLIKLLCYMPNIECLVIWLDDVDLDAYLSWTHETVPQCSLLNLKSVEITHFNGRKNELCLIAYLLVRTLEKMIISFNDLWDDPVSKNTIVKDILILPRGSAGTQVIVR